MKWSRACMLGLVAALLSLPAGAQRGPVTIVGPSEAVPLQYFGLHVHRPVPTKRFPQPAIWPTVRFGQWRLLNTLVSWPQLEPKQGAMDFETLDKIVQLASAKNVGLLYPFALTPTWASARNTEPSVYNQPGWAAEPRDMELWRNYVNAVSSRYKGRIESYEIWNEPNLKDTFSGTMDQMIAMAREAHSILKSNNPAATVVSPSPASGPTGVDWLDKFAASGGLKYADVVGYHFYSSTPESAAGDVQQVRAVLARHGAASMPIWNTESGWRVADDRPNPKRFRPNDKQRILSIDEAGAFVARAHLLLWASGVKRFYWYGWDTLDMGLTDPDGQTVKANARAYDTMARWMLGAKVSKCESDAKGIWMCELLRDGTPAARVIWSPQREQSIALPSAWGVTRITDIQGRARSPAGPEETIGPSPVLLSAG